MRLLIGSPVFWEEGVCGTVVDSVDISHGDLSEAENEGKNLGKPKVFSDTNLKRKNVGEFDCLIPFLEEVLNI